MRWRAHAGLMLKARKASVRMVLVWTQRTLFAGAILMLGYCGFVLLDIWRFQHQERQNLERLLDEERQAQAVSSASPVAVRSLAPIIGPDGLIGRMEVPRLNLSVMWSRERTSRRLDGPPGTLWGPGCRDDQATSESQLTGTRFSDR